MIELGRAADGRLVLGSSQPFPADIKHVEYYRDQRLFSLVFETEDEQSQLMPCEISPQVAATVQSAPNIMVIAMARPGQEAYGYTVPLIQIGI